MHFLHFYGSFRSFWKQKQHFSPGGRGGELYKGGQIVVGSWRVGGQIVVGSWRDGGQIVVSSWRVGGQIEGSWRVEVVNLCLQRPVAGPVTVLPATSWECPNSSLSPPIPLQLLFNLSFLQTESPHLSCLSSERCNQAEIDNWQSLLETSRYHELARSRKNMCDLTANLKWLPLLEILLCSSSRLHRQKLLSAKLYTLVALALQGFTPVCHWSCRNRGCVLRSTRLAPCSWHDPSPHQLHGASVAKTLRPAICPHFGHRTHFFLPTIDSFFIIIE